MPPSSSPRRALATALVLATVALSVHARCTTFGFTNFDDPDYVTANPAVRSGLEWSSIVWAFTSSHAANWHPLTWLSHMLDWQLFGPWAGGHHLTSVVLHAAATVLLFVALWRATGALGRSAVVALLFALHPTRVESVVWVAERKDTLSACLWMASLVAYVEWVRRPGIARYVTLLGVYALALLAKPMVVTLPAALLLLDWWPLRRLPTPAWRGVVVEKLPLFALAAGTSVVTVLVQGAEGAVAGLDAVPFGARVGNAVVAWVRYLGLLAWPVHLAPFYPYRIWPAATVGAAAALLAAITYAALALARRHPYVAVGWAWFVGTLVPVIGLIQVGSQGLADRFTYIPAVGVFLLAVWGFSDLTATWPRRRTVLTALVGALLGVYTVLTVRQAGHWQDSPSLFRHTLAVTRDNTVAHHNYAEALRQQGDAAGAVWHAAEAVRISPRNASAWVTLATARAHEGQLAEAQADLERALAIAPRLVTAHNTLGVVRAARGDPEGARQAFEAATAIDPAYPNARANFGDFWRRQGRAAEAIAQYRVAAALRPDWVDVEHHLGVLLADAGDPVAAAEHLEAALRLQQPASATTLSALAWLRATATPPGVRDGAEAVRLAERARAVSAVVDTSLLDVLAAAYAEAGRFPEAIATAEAALAGAGPATPPALVSAVGARLALYRDGRPARERADGPTGATRVEVQQESR